jgi:hypothetical protein
LFTCFVSAPAGVNLARIKKLLLEKGLEFIHPSEILSYGQSISEKINTLISQSDIFIAVFEDKFERGNTFFELGIAVARKKQIIILTSPSFPLPSDLTGFLTLKISQDNFDALDFAIDQLLAATIKKKRKKEPRSFKGFREVGKPVGNKIFELKHRLDNLDPGITGDELENFVSDLLKESGISVIQQSKMPDVGADIAIWSDDLGAILGNPILIEIKRNIRNRSQALQVTNQLLSYLQKTNSRFAIVLYLEGLPSSSIQEFSKQFNVLFFQLGDFVEQLQNKSFADTIRIHRNIIAHGGDV